MQVSRNATTNVIEMIGSSLGERPGCVIEEVDQATIARIQTALAQPNGGVTLSADHKTVVALPVPAPSQAEQDAATAKATALATLKNKTATPAARLDALIVALGL